MFSGYGTGNITTTTSAPTNHYKPNSSVAKVFWDLNHCPIPHYCISFTLTKSISDIATEFISRLGGESISVSINAYGSRKDLDILPSVEYSPVRIDTIDTHELSKECSSEKLLISDVAIFPLECSNHKFVNVSLVSVIVISNDISVLYTLRSLNRCGIKTCMITNIVNHVTGSEMCEYLNWTDITSSLSNHSTHFPPVNKFELHAPTLPPVIPTETKIPNLLVPSYFSSNILPVTQEITKVEQNPQLQNWNHPPRINNLKKRVITEEYSKAALQYYFQTNLHGLPKYHTRQRGKGHSLIFETTVRFSYYNGSEYLFGHGKDTTKKESEKLAALDACNIIIKRFPEYQFPENYYTIKTT